MGLNRAAGKSNWRLGRFANKIRTLAQSGDPRRTRSPHPSSPPGLKLQRMDKSNESGRWQSDVIVDLIKRYGFRYITLNPGASFRGLHDSLVNYGGNDPPMLVCQHEEIAVQIGHGYAKAKGEPALVILHNLVGLLHATMAIYYAFIDRAPVFIIGATGPMHEGKRRPHIDWSHSALVQGEAVRNFVKWDYQPAAIEGVPESFARAYSVMTTEPQGPVYMCYDAWLQEEPLTRDAAAAAGRRRRHPRPDDARPEGARRDRRPACRGGEPAALSGIRRPPSERLFRHGGARRDGRRGGLGREQRAELSEPPSALREPRQGGAAQGRPRRRPRRAQLGAADARAEQHDARGHPYRPGELPTGWRSASPRLGSANGPSTMAACSPARCARSATPRSASPSSLASAANASPPIRPPAAASTNGARRSAAATTRSGRAGRRMRARLGTPRRWRCRGSRARSGRSSRTRIGCWRAARCGAGRESSGISTPPIGIRARASAPHADRHLARRGARA